MVSDEIFRLSKEVGVYLSSKRGMEATGVSPSSKLSVPLVENGVIRETEAYLSMMVIFSRTRGRIKESMKASQTIRSHGKEPLDSSGKN